MAKYKLCPVCVARYKGNIKYCKSDKAFLLPIESMEAVYNSFNNTFLIKGIVENVKD